MFSFLFQHGTCPVCRKDLNGIDSSLQDNFPTPVDLIDNSISQNNNTQQNNDDDDSWIVCFMQCVLFLEKCLVFFFSSFFSDFLLLIQEDMWYLDALSQLPTFYIIR